MPTVEAIVGNKIAPGLQIGTFDSRAHAKSYELWASLNRPWIAALAGGIIASGTCYLAFRSWNGNRTLKGKAVRILRRAA
jgi:hypothetical protein